MDKRQLELIADGAIDVAFKHMQDKIGVTNGDFAGMFMSGTHEENLKALFVQYMGEELGTR